MRLSVRSNQVVKVPDDLPEDQAAELVSKGFLRDITVTPGLVDAVAAALPSVSAVPQRPAGLAHGSIVSASGGLGSKLSN
jgi:hypothetical protein